MHILLVPDSFKESLSAAEVAEALARGFQASQLNCTVEKLPIGDGGEGTVAALAASLGMVYTQAMVTGPFGQVSEITYALKENQALVEMAEVAGLAKIPLSQRNPLQVSSQGLGELILQLAQEGVTKIMVGVGGSASQDGGIGMAAGLGYHFLDTKGQVLEPLGVNLEHVAKISDQEVPTYLQDLELTIITDVTNPLCGPQGATYVFAGQKGLPEDEFAVADQAMEQFYQLANPQILQQDGAGAGGGMAAGLATFAGGKIVSGIDTILDLVDFDRRVQTADLVVVGEGRMDKQSLAGKAPVGVARRTPSEIPVLAICGSLKDDLPDFPTANVQAAFSIISQSQPLETILTQASTNLERTARNIGNVLALGR
ncbi:glycerate kinase family protein [Streptococcus dentapri]|uniref:Glycerate kinase n=1 Tax=Streptococcus dentapri TaxID=573564 RepID=A0ABV8D3R2_9STRE